MSTQPTPELDDTDVPSETAGLELPDFIGQSASVPELDDLGRPLRVIRQFEPYPFDRNSSSPASFLVTFIESAQELDLQLRITNIVAEVGEIEFQVSVMSGASEISQTDAVWANNPTTSPIVRVGAADEDQLEELLADPRWKSHHARLITVSMQDGDIASAVTLVDFVDEPIPAD
ncbi:hypothetical protein [Microbacterium sp. NPDC076911]|uniref:hypothetical protein n=1 Tax=Microbacterium sp. NPDC076911 TaxID=3154958 RepID=UPI003431C7CA